MYLMTENEIEKAAAELAEKSNGGKWDDPRYYVASHKVYWRGQVAKTLPGKREALDMKVDSKQTAVTPEEVKAFSSHCIFIRSVYVMGMRIWRDSNEAERKIMEAAAPHFFQDFSSVLGEFLVIAASRITDPAVDFKGNENFTVELLDRACPREDKRYVELEALRVQMNKLRDKI